MSSRRGSIEIIARGVLISHNRVLLCRNVKRGHCYLPGGHVEFGEESTAALSREFREECGLKIRVGELLLCHEQRFRERKSDKHELNLVFHVEHHGTMGKGPVRSLEHHIEFIWADSKALPKLTLLPEIMKKYIRGWIADQSDSAVWQST